MACPLCGTRRAKRACPAIGQQICSVCCATKRLTEIQCPSSCAYLAAAREHPAASVLRRQHHDAAFVMRLVRDFSERQSQLLLLVATYLVRHQAPEIQPLIDQDVADAVTALASTYETAVRGVIYDHRPASLPAQHVVGGLTPLLAEAGKNGGTAFERDAAVVLRRVAEAIADLRVDDGDPRGFLDLLGRVFAHDPAGTDAAEPQREPPRLILP